MQTYVVSYAIVTLSRIHWRFSENAGDMCDTDVNANHGEKNVSGVDNLLNNKQNRFGRIQLMITITVIITCHFYLSITIMITVIRHYNYRLRLRL